MSTFYLAISQRIVGDAVDHDVVYATDGREFVSRETAIRVTTHDLGHDDFCIATVTDGRIVAFGWGMDDFGADTDGTPWHGHDLDDIARQIGLSAPERAS